MPPKNDSPKTSTEAAVGVTTQEKTEKLPPAALGSVIGVKVAPGQVLVNNETGTRFEEDTETPQTVTVTTLRRLEDGCLVRVS